MGVSAMFTSKYDSRDWLYDKLWSQRRHSRHVRNGSLLTLGSSLLYNTGKPRATDVNVGRERLSADDDNDYH